MDAAVADIGGGREPDAVDQIGLDVVPARRRQRGADLDIAVGRAAPAQADLGGADAIALETLDEIAVDRKPAGPVSLLVTRVHHQIVERLVAQRHRSEERPGGKECVRTFRYRWSPGLSKQQKTNK